MIEVPNDEGLDISCQIRKVFCKEDISQTQDIVDFKVNEHKFSFNFPVQVLNSDNIEQKMEELKDTAIRQYYQLNTAVKVGRA